MKPHPALPDLIEASDMGSIPACRGRSLITAAIGILLLCCAALPRLGADDLERLPPLNTPNGSAVSQENGLILSSIALADLGRAGYSVQTIRSDWTIQQRSVVQKQNLVLMPFNPRPMPDDERTAIQGPNVQANQNLRLLFIPHDVIPNVPPPGGGPSSERLSWSLHANRTLIKIPLQLFLKIAMGDERKPVTDVPSGIAFWRPVTGFVLSKQYTWPKTDAFALTDLNIDFHLEATATACMQLELLLRAIPGMDMAMAADEFGVFSPEFASALLASAPDIVPGTGGIARGIRACLLASSAGFSAYRYQSAKSDGDRIAAIVEFSSTCLGATGVWKSTRPLTKAGIAPQRAVERRAFIELVGDDATAFRTIFDKAGKQLDTAALLLDNATGSVTLLGAQELNRRLLMGPSNFFLEQFALIKQANPQIFDSLVKDPWIKRMLASRTKLEWGPISSWGTKAGSWNPYIDVTDLNPNMSFLRMLMTWGHEDFHRYLPNSALARKICWTTKIDGVTIATRADFIAANKGAMIIEETLAFMRQGAIGARLTDMGLTIADLDLVDKTLIAIFQKDLGTGTAKWGKVKALVTQAYDTPISNRLGAFWDKAVAEGLDIGSWDGVSFVRIPTTPP